MPTPVPGMIGKILAAWGMPNVTSGEMYDRAVEAAKIAGPHALRTWADRYEAEWAKVKTGGMWRKRVALDNARRYATDLEK
jgi:hypothetical protein